MLISLALFISTKIIYILHGNVTFASRLAALGRGCGFSFYLGLVYNLLLIKARAERDLELGLLRADVGRIEMSGRWEFGFERNPEMPPAAFLRTWQTKQIPPCREKVGRGSLQGSPWRMRAPRELLAANAHGRWGMDTLIWGWASSPCPTLSDPRDQRHMAILPP